MPPRPPTSVIDVLHRGFVTACLGVFLLGGVMAVSTHNNTMRKGQEAYEAHLRKQREQAAETGSGVEDRLANAAQDVVAARSQDIAKRL
ncbi:hypothetical protein PIIN_02247 [Serendipita indica DSM 11827]|uniref:Uncharacterized protein n=1 Tax=Serendipita indica (strain DSM 11827) TaxID=1109443 RepID=G4TAQ2_SERID|nr:hypothetical protein PIIN_02247 [Serendipita indica DSM 11827]